MQLKGPRLKSPLILYFKCKPKQEINCDSSKVEKSNDGSNMFVPEC